MLPGGVSEWEEQKKQKHYRQADGSADYSFSELPHPPFLRRLEEFFDLGEHILDYMPEVAVFFDFSDPVGNGAPDFFTSTDGRIGDGVRPLYRGPDEMQLSPTRAAELAMIAIFGGTVRTEHKAPSDRNSLICLGS
jgi:hypothetical protein